MESVTQVQILGEIVCVSLQAKEKYESISSLHSTIMKGGFSPVTLVRKTVLEKENSEF